VADRGTVTVKGTTLTWTPSLDSYGAYNIQFRLSDAGNAFPHVRAKSVNLHAGEVIE